MITMGALAGALIEGGAVGFSTPLVVVALAVAVLAGAAFFAVETRTSHLMLPLGLFRRSAFAGPALLGLLINVAFYGLIFVFSLFFQREQGFSALQAGLAFLPITAVVLVANLVARPIGAAVGTRSVILLGLSSGQQQGRRWSSSSSSWVRRRPSSPLLATQSPTSNPARRRRQPEPHSAPIAHAAELSGVG